jgi:hypothetical protein
MSHIFISYSSKNESYRDEVITWLGGLGFQVWYDKRDIKRGNQWIQEIDKAVDEAGLVILIFTPDALRSHYVTYECSRAMGRDIDVLPLKFEEFISEEFQNNPLIYLQSEDCTQGISERTLDEIKVRFSTPPDVLYMEYIIVAKILKFRVMVYLLLWLAQYINPRDGEYFVKLQNLIHEMLEENKRIRGLEIPELMVKFSHALTWQQRITIRRLLAKMKEFWEIFHVTDASDRYYIEAGFELSKAETFRQLELESILGKLFEGHYHDNDFRKLQQFLEDISARKRTNFPSLFLYNPFTVMQSITNSDDEFTLITSMVRFVIEKLNKIGE